MATNNPDNIWKQCTSLQIQMKKSLKSNNNPFRKEIEELRTQLRKNYLYLLEDHSEFSFNDKDVLVNLWKFVFYKQIEFCRKQLRKQNKESEERTELINKLTDKIIPDAKSVYNALLNKHLKKSLISYDNNKYNDDLLTTKVKSLSVSMKAIKLSLQIAHKSLIYIGDLERYRETYLSNSNYDAAKSSYCLALELMPIRGNPHNQLAVLNQMQINCDLAAIYRYVLSLFVIEPFMTAKENLSLLFKKTISLVDKNDNNNNNHHHHHIYNGNNNTDNMLKNISSKSTWKELQIYVIYVLAIVYQDNYRSNSKYHKILTKIQPVILDKISKILLINKNKRNNQNDDEQEQKQKEIGEQDNDNIIKQLCIISLFLVHETFNEDNNFIGYKQAISWTLSLIATMMEATINVNNLSLLKPITLCCLWLQNNFDFAVPNIDKAPWAEMAIDQQDLKPNNAFFSQLSKLLNLLHVKYQNDKQIQNINKKQIITPEQVEFYGINQLRFINFDDTKYKLNDSHIFIYHRRYCSDENNIINNNNNNNGGKINNSNISKKALNYLRYLKLVKFAKFSSQQIDGVLVFNDNKWIANNLQLTDETPPQQPQQQQLPPSAHHQQQQQLPPQHPQHHQIIMHQLTPQQSHSAQNPTTAPQTNINPNPAPITHSPPSPPMNYPPLPRQHSQPDPHTKSNNPYHKSPQYSPNYPSSHRYGSNNNNNNGMPNPSKTPNHLPSQHSATSASYQNLRLGLPNPAHSGHTASHHHHGGSRHARIHNNTYPRSAPVSPRGMSGNQYPSQQSRAHMPAPLMEEMTSGYPEDSEITIPIPFSNNGFPEHMIKSTPTTPIGSQNRHYSYHGHDQQKHQHQTQQSSARYHPQSQQFGQPLFQQISETHSDHEYEYQHPPTSNTRNNKPTLAPPSHSHHTNVGGTHSFQLGSRSNHAPSGSGPVTYSQTPDVNTTSFSFSPYGAAANGQGYGGSSHLGGGHGHPSNMPVTQPTTPVFASHHSSQSYASTHHGPSPHQHLYPHHSHHGHNPMTATAKYAEAHTPNVNGNGHNNNTLHPNPYQSTLPQQQHSGPSSMHTGHTPNNTLFDNIDQELTSPLMFENLTEEIVADVFNDLQLNH